jgi:hypothetical protein
MSTIGRQTDRECPATLKDGDRAIRSVSTIVVDGSYVVAAWNARHGDPIGSGITPDIVKVLSSLSFMPGCCRSALRLQ